MNAVVAVKRPARVTWVAALGVCALWLVVQNAVLITALALMHPGLPGSVVVGAARALARVVSVASEAISSIALAVPGWVPANVLSTLTGGLI